MEQIGCPKMSIRNYHYLLCNNPEEYCSEKWSSSGWLQEKDKYIQSLMFILCIIRNIRKDQQYALICTTPLFYVLAPTCFSSSLPSSGSFVDPPDLLEIQIEWVVYRIMCGYVTYVPDCHGSVMSPNKLYWN
jgi:hypothetical protein